MNILAEMSRDPHICAYIQVLFVPNLFAAFLIAYVYNWDA